MSKEMEEAALLDALRRKLKSQIPWDVELYARAMPPQWKGQRPKTPRILVGYESKVDSVDGLRDTPSLTEAEQRSTIKVLNNNAKENAGESLNGQAKDDQRLQPGSHDKNKVKVIGSRILVRYSSKFDIIDGLGDMQSLKKANQRPMMIVVSNNAKEKAGESSNSQALDEPGSPDNNNVEVIGSRRKKKRHPERKECKKMEIKKPRQVRINLPPLPPMFNPLDMPRDHLERKNHKKKENKKLRQVRINLPPPPPVFNPLDMTQEWKDFIEGRLRGTEITRVCQKTLTKTDVKLDQRRLLLPQRLILTLDFLREDEKEVVSLPSTTSELRHIPVMVVGTSRQEHLLSFRMWHMKKDNGKTSIVYVLTEAWNDFVVDNNLVEGIVVQIWSFRAVEDGRMKLHMAIVVVGRQLADEDDIA